MRIPSGCERGWLNRADWRDGGEGAPMGLAQVNSHREKAESS